jgi:hypothetical protein
MDFGECCGVIKAACTLKIEVQAAFGLCQLEGRGFTGCVVAAIESVNLTESSLHGFIFQAPAQIPQKICYNFALSALQTQGAVTISTHIAHPLCFNESTNTVLKAGTRYCRNQLCRLLYYFTHPAECQTTRIPQKQPATL